MLTVDARSYDDELHRDGSVFHLGAGMDVHLCAWLQHDPEAHILEPHLADERVGRATELNELYVESFVEDRLVMPPDAVFGDAVQIAVLQVDERVGRTASADDAEHGDALAQGEKHFFGRDAATAQHEQARLADARVGEQPEQFDVLGQVAVPARRCAGTLLEDPEQVQQWVGDGAFVHVLGELEAGVLPAIAKCLVGARRVTPGSGPQLRVVGVVPLGNGVGQAWRFHRGHRSGERSIHAQDPRTTAADGDSIEPEGLRRVAAEQSTHHVEHGVALGLCANTRGAGDIEVADDAPHGAKDNRSGNLLVDTADHQGYIAATGAGDEPCVPGLARNKELVVANGH